MQLGGAAGDISEMVLRQIERTVKSIERQERDRLAKKNRLKDNISRDDNERSGEHGDHIHAAGRLPDTRPDAGRTGDTPHREIRDAEEDVSEEPQERDIRGAAAVREAGQPSGGDRPDGAGTGGSGDGADGERQGVTEALKARDPMKWTGLMNMIKLQAEEAVLEPRPHQQLTLFPTTEEQIESIRQAEADKTSAFSISQAEIDEVLTRGSGVADGKYRIYLYFLEAAYPAGQGGVSQTHEYGIGGRSMRFKGLTIVGKTTAAKASKSQRAPCMNPDAEITADMEPKACEAHQRIDRRRPLPFRRGKSPASGLSGRTSTECAIRCAGKDDGYAPYRRIPSMPWAIPSASAQANIPLLG